MIKVNKWHSLQIPTKSWIDIKENYEQLIDKGLELEPMLELVNYIIDSGIQNRISAFVSMKTLVISIYDKIEWRRENLRIEFDLVTRKWFYEYHSRPDKPIQFKRQYSEELGIEKFNQFLEFIKW